MATKKESDFIQVQAGLLLDIEPLTAEEIRATIGSPPPIILKDVVQELELEDHKEKAAAWRPTLGE